MSEVQKDVCLVEVPFSAYATPILSLSLMKGALLREGISAKVFYGNIMFAATSDTRLYDQISGWTNKSTLASDCVFAAAAHELTEEELIRAYRSDLSNLLVGFTSDDYIERICCNISRLAAYVPDFLNALADKILACSPKVIGLASLFFQNNGCFALAKQLKKKAPHIPIVMGGGNCVAEAGAAICRTIPYIDCVFSGEADECFPELCRLLMEYGPDIPLDKLPYGAMTKKSIAELDRQGCRDYPVRRTRNLDELPYPDFDDFFDALKEFGMIERAHTVMMAEFSRGCWWQDKQGGCTFCGMNSAGNCYRAKSPERCLAELEYLRDRHGINRFTLVDNILSPLHFQKVLPKMAEMAAEGKGFSMVAEVKSNLTRDELKLLLAAGFSIVQPGIENLQDDLLREMNKGNRGIKHIELLKRGRELGISIAWNLLGGFPYEKEASYAELASYVPHITHLKAPVSFGHIDYVRHSIYCDHPERYGLTISPLPTYRSVFPLGEDFIRNTACYFCSTEPQELLWRLSLGKKSPAHLQAETAFTAWMSCAETCPDRLDYTVATDGSSIEIFDLRQDSTETMYTITGLAAEIFRRADSVIRQALLRDQLMEVGYSAEEIDACLDDLINCRKLIIEIRGELLTVAVNTDHAKIPALEDYPIGYVRYPTDE